ncbi:SPOR domain-containing protein [Deinococcus frigens]|uniref:SPOR domain-containing protein n=1 Tax=Deinococcus frigens TaxID=249403 RepID=UPI000497B397|nr:SPOR domain-containing protein [Deinococcus frigens]
MSKPAATRRWPDILIGVLVLLLLGGFAALLLGQRKTATTTTTTTAPANSGIPTAPGTAQDTTATTTETTTITPPAADTTPPSDTDTGSVNTDTTMPADTDTPSADAGTEAPIIPAAPTNAAATAPDTANGTDTQTGQTPTAETPTSETQTSEAQTSETLNPETQNSETQTPDTPTPQAQITETPTNTPPAETPAATVTPRSGGAVATSESRTPLRSDYRISLGTFGSVGTAQSRTAPVSSLGYRVYPIDLGAQVVAQVGPFADEASARQALGDIQRAYPGALLYPPRAGASSAPSTSESSSGSSSDAPAPAASPAPAPASSAQTAAPAAPAGPIYLQVGAFDRVESAQKLVDELRDLGYVPTVNAPEGRKVTVAVGPYTGDALTRTEKRLDDNDLDHFRVR